MITPAEFSIAGILPDEACGLSVKILRDIEPRTVEWLWAQRIPLGKITMLCGDPGSGKSYASLAMAAGLSKGWHLPGDDRRDEPCDSVFLNFEDDDSDTLRPRADRLGADLTRIHSISGVFENGSLREFSACHVEHLDDFLEDHPGVRLVVIDPVANLLSSVDTNRDNVVRTALSPLKLLADKRNVAVVCVMHLRKSEAERAIYRASGSIGFVALARSVLLVASEPESNRRSISRLKGNLSAEPSPVEFEITDADGFAWKGIAPDLTAERMLASPTGPRAKARSDAEEFLRELLADGPMNAADAVERGAANGFSERTLRRARKELAVRVEKSRSSHGHWTWSLEGGQDDAPAMSNGHVGHL